MRYSILDTPLDDFSISDITAKVRNKERILQVFINLHKIALFNNNRDFKVLLQNQNCIFSCDGRWVFALAKLYRIPIQKSFGGIDIINEFIALSQNDNLRVYLLGAQKGVLLKAKNKLLSNYPNVSIAGIQNGYFDNENNVIEDIAQKRPHILFIALPSPRKEILANKIFLKVNSLLYVVGVGGAFDILADKYKRAPVFLQKIGLEWFYRSCQKPALFKRYISDFLYLIKLIVKNDYKR